jgi:hypothetical protein
MEEWNNGFEGVFLQLKWFISVFIPNIPAFHYSIIPWKWHKIGAIKRPLISNNCRIS